MAEPSEYETNTAYPWQPVSGNHHRHCHSNQKVSGYSYRINLPERKGRRDGATEGQERNQ